jgi:excisionase family DNA binding protein
MENSILIRNMTVDELKDIIRVIVKEEIQLASTTKRSESKYLTRKEAATFLKISLPTLNNYTKSGRIIGFRIGSRVLFKLADLEQSLNEIVTSRYAHGKLR